MPTLDWLGKKAVINHHREVPFHLLEELPELSAGDPDTGNLLVQGDNLLALKALLPYYAQQVKCIYIDPPYNTGNEGWIYNDAVNSPEIREWLGRVVGGEAEDLSRHDKWLCMMYPRLQLLRQFLRDDGAIFVSIDDKEVHHLRLLLDEIFGARNFVATVIWQKVHSPKNSARHLSEDHDYVIIYAKDAERWHPNLLARNAVMDNRYSNPDNDPRGPWTSSDISARNFYSLGTYPIQTPAGRQIAGPAQGRYWSVSAETFAELDRDNRIWWGTGRGNMPRLKRFLSDVKDGIVPQTLWFHQSVGNTQEAKKELVSVVEFATSDDVFITPKPLRLMRRILEIGADKDSLVLDSFAGSGTLGHAALAANKEDGGTRRCILVEMDERIARDVTAQRMHKAIDGYTPLAGNTEPVAPLGGGFKFCTLAEPLFDETGSIRAGVSYDALAAHVFFTHTGRPLNGSATPPFLGTADDGEAVYLLYNGVLGDRRPQGGNILTTTVLDSLPKHGIRRVVYGEGCRIGDARLARENVTFRQTPYQIRTW